MKSRLSRAPRRSHRLGTNSQPSQERLEERLPLTADLALASPLADQTIVESDTVDVSFEFTDTVNTSAGNSVGLDPSAFTSLGDFTAASDLFINTSDAALTIRIDPNLPTQRDVLIPGLSLTDGTTLSNGDPNVLATGVVFDKDLVLDTDGMTVLSDGPAVETLVFSFDNFSIGSGFELTGVGDLPIALLATGNLTVDGVIDVGAQFTGNTADNNDRLIPGAGGGLGGWGDGPSDGSPALGAPADSVGRFRGGTFGNNGSGAGFGGEGGDGGPSTVLGGISYGDLATIGIQGGSGGGAGATGFGNRLGQGGDGGGGIELGALGDVSITGTVTADAGELVFFGGTTRRAGGGAGGGILIHGDDVTLGTGSLLSADGTESTLSGGAGAGGRVLLAHAGTLTQAGEVTADASDGGALEAAGVVETLEIIPETSQDNYDFVVDLLDSAGAFIETLASGPVTDIVLNTAGDALTGSVALTGLASALFADDADLQVRVTVSDDQATPNSVTDIAELTVANDAPNTLALGAVAAIDENGTATLDLTFEDAGLIDEHTVTVDWGDGTVEDVTLAVGDRAATLTHQYLDDDPTGTLSDSITIDITVTDDDTDSTGDTTSVVVSNVAPELTSLSTDSSVIFEGAQQGEAVNLTASFTDVGTLDTHAATIDWGDGTVETVAAAGGAIAGSHTYEHGGFYDVTVTLTDDDTGATSELTQTVISGVGIQDGTLVGIGTNGNDKFKIYECYGHYYVKTKLDGGGSEWKVLEGPIDGIDLYLGAGDDTGFVSRWIDVDVYMDGGAGNDWLIGGRGNDLLLGGAGNDYIFGRRGRDITIGGEGSDALFGDGGQDVLISGTSSHDGNREALDMILAEWASDRSFSERVDNLTGDLDMSGDGLNGDNFFIGSGDEQTVFDDDAFDFMYGGFGSDLHFVGEGDLSLAGFFDQVEAIEGEAPAS